MWKSWAASGGTTSKLNRSPRRTKKTQVDRPCRSTSNTLSRPQWHGKGNCNSIAALQCCKNCCGCNIEIADRDLRFFCPQEIAPGQPKFKHNIEVGAKGLVVRISVTLTHVSPEVETSVVDLRFFCPSRASGNQSCMMFTVAGRLGKLDWPRLVLCVLLFPALAAASPIRTRVT